MEELIFGYACDRKLRESAAGTAWLASRQEDNSRAVLYAFPKTDGNARHIQHIRRYIELLNRLPEARQRNLLPVVQSGEDQSFFYCMTAVADETLAEKVPEISRSNRQLLSIAQTVAESLQPLREENFTHIAINADNIFFKDGMLLVGLPTEIYTGPAFHPPESDDPYQQDTDLYALGKLLYQLDTALPPQNYPAIQVKPMKPGIPALLQLWTRLASREPANRLLQFPIILKSIADIRSDLEGKHTSSKFSSSKYLIAVELLILVGGICLFLLSQFRSRRKYISIFDAIRGNAPQEVASIIWNSGELHVRENNLLPIQLAFRQKTPSPRIIQTLIDAGACKEFTDARAAIWEIIRQNHSLAFFQLVFTSCRAKRQLIKQEGSAFLHASIENKNPAIVNFLLQQGADMETCDSNGISPLLKALSLEQEQAALFLLEKGASSKTAPDGTAPIHLIGNSPELAEALFKTEDDVNLARKDGATPLLLAVRRRRPCAIIQTLLQNNANPGLADAWGDTPLLASIRNGDLETAILLHQAGASLSDTSNPRRLSPLHIAAICDRPAILSWLLEQKTDPSLSDAAGRTPLHWAAFRDNADCVKLLLRANAKATLKDNLGFTPADMAFIGDAKTTAPLLPAPGKPSSAAMQFQSLLRKATPQPYPDSPAPELLPLLENPDTPQEQLLDVADTISSVDEKLLRAALLRNEPQFLDYLLQRPLPRLDDALAFASVNAKEQAVESLCRAGANFNSRTSEGKTPLDLAFEAARHDVVHYLILCNPDIYLKNDAPLTAFWRERLQDFPNAKALENITTPFDFLCARFQEGNVASVRHALQNYALSANFEPRLGTSALAAGSVSLPMAQVLLRQGANPQHSPSAHLSLLEYSIGLGQPISFQKLLLDYGASPVVQRSLPGLLGKLLCFYMGTPIPRTTTDEK